MTRPLLVTGCWVAASLLGAPAVRPGAAGQVTDRGVFLICRGDSLVGREEFVVTSRPDGGLEARSESHLRLAGATGEVVTVLYLALGFRPESVRVEGTVNGISVRDVVVWRDTQAVIRREGSVQTLSVSRDALFLGRNLFLPYTFLLARYDTIAAGPQRFAVFPNRDAVVTPDVSARGVGGTRAYTLAIGSSEAVALIDSAARLVAVRFPRADLTVVRRGGGVAPEEARRVLRSAAGTAPPVVDTTRFRDVEIAVRRDGFSLAGGLLLPRDRQGPFPAVVIISGSGQQDRDGTLPAIGLADYRPYRQFAEAIAARGLAVLRMDDRGAGRSGGRGTLDTATTASFARDVQEAVTILRRRPEVLADRVGLLGHSEGALIALMVAAEDRRVAAVGLLAGHAVPGDSLLRHQLLEVLANADSATRTRALAQQRALFDTLRAGGRPALVPNAEWYRSFIRIDAAPFIQRVGAPLLIVHGALDRQVPSDNAERLARLARAAGNTRVTLRVFEGLNHLLVPAATGRPDEYARLTSTQVGQELLDFVAEWFASQLGP